MVTLLGCMGDVLYSLGHMVMGIVMQHDVTPHDPIVTLSLGAGTEVS
jgi:hypothetical protein